MVLAVNPEESAAEGGVLIVMVMGDEISLQPLASNTSTVIASPVTKSLRVIELTVEEAPKLTPFRMKW